eukprot:Plantae.Rhodophyta-Hildenbrandia_rubra.ctg6288.p1 GENE.Plantae.Rhodophyta-Hildenbrandia_rubra.ctg6288~~Plantae.Rhodophyta-Hildenbrandia_rubra.ctg6288.p1  ORF type:complete len:558 (+),score=80.04 Plantae.Rhodophyta-Hildenbrandia_rubra.ctg6288:825-2498(+)
MRLFGSKSSITGFLSQTSAFFTPSSATVCPFRPDNSLQGPATTSARSINRNKSDKKKIRKERQFRRIRKLESRKQWATTVTEECNMPPLSQKWVSCSMPKTHVGSKAIFNPHDISELYMAAPQHFHRMPEKAPILVANITSTPLVIHKNQLLGDVLKCRQKPAFVSAAFESDGKSAKISFDQEHMEAPANPPALDTRISKDAKLSVREMLQLKRALSRSGDIISAAADPGRADVPLFKIEAADTRPMRKPPYRNARDAEFIDHWADEKLNLGMAQHSKSEWAFPIIVARQPSKKPRACIDCRLLNEASKSDAYALPRQDDAIDALKGAKIFSALDLARGLHQQVIEPESRDKAAFVTRRGLFEWAHAPFGLKNGPAAFQRLMQIVLQKLCWRCCLLHLDDIIACSSSFEERLKHLQEAFDALRQAASRLRSEKCHFAAHSVSYLGHIISESGAQVGPRKVKATRELATPANFGALRRFLGVTNHHRRFIPHYSAIMAPLTSLMSQKSAGNEKTDKGAKVSKAKQAARSISWSPECASAFERQKVIIGSASFGTSRLR